jgi:hypothetical protein
MARWSWNEGDMRDALFNCDFTPSYFVKGELWECRVNKYDERTRICRTNVEGVMYLVSFFETGALDGHFDYCALDLTAYFNEGVVYELVGASSIYSGNGIPFAEVMLRGVVMVAEIERYESSFAQPHHEDSEKDSDGNTKWWNVEHDPWRLATEIGEERKSGGWGVNQTGARAGKHPISSLGEAVAARIAKVEKVSGTARTIGGKTIVNYLKWKGWR